MPYDPKHGQTCVGGCGKRTYRRSGLCWGCDPEAPRKPRREKCGPDPESLPEDYLMACAQELLRRHEVRDELLRQIGLRGAA